MSSDSTMFAAVHRQLVEAEETGYKRILHIRITPDAIPGSIAAVPITPERARVIGQLMAVRDWQDLGIAVDADPHWYEQHLELLIHPEDWAALLSEKDAYGAFVPGIRDGEPTRVLGIPVSGR